MINRGPIWILCMVFLLAACSDKGTKPPTPPPPVEPIHLVEGYPSWSPDGRYIYYNHEARDTLELMRYGYFSIWAYDTQTQKCGFVIGPGQFAKPNPDGTILAFNWGQIFFYYLNLGTVKQITHANEVFEFEWAPSGQSLILSQGDGRLIDTSGTRYGYLLPQNDSNSTWRGSGSPHWFSENRILVVSRDFLERTGILILDTLGTIIDTVVIDDSPRSYLGGFDYVNMSPDQSKIITTYTYVTPDGQHSLGDFRQYSPDGTLLRILNPDGGGMGRWSPDGSKIVFQYYTFMGENPNPEDPDYGRVTPWICNPDGSDMHELLGWPQPLPDTTMFGGGYNWVTDTHNP